MFWFKNFRIRRKLCTHCCARPSILRVITKSGKYTYHKGYCREDAFRGVYWAAADPDSKIYYDTGA